MNELTGNLATALDALLDKGGPTMIALGLLSVAVVAVFLIRVLALVFPGSGGIVSVLSAAARKAVDDGSDAARQRLEVLATLHAAALRSGFRFIDLAATAATAAWAAWHGTRHDRGIPATGSSRQPGGTGTACRRYLGGAADHGSRHGCRPGGAGLPVNPGKPCRASKRQGRARGQRYHCRSIVH